MLRQFGQKVEQTDRRTDTLEVLAQLKQRTPRKTHQEFTFRKAADVQSPILQKVNSIISVSPETFPKFLERTLSRRPMDSCFGASDSLSKNKFKCITVTFQYTLERRSFKVTHVNCFLTFKCLAVCNNQFQKWVKILMCMYILICLCWNTVIPQSLYRPQLINPIVHEVGKFTHPVDFF